MATDNSLLCGFISYNIFSLWYRIVTAGMEGMTAQDPPDCHPATAQRAKSLDRLYCILGTGGLKATDWREQGRNKKSIAAN